MDSFGDNTPDYRQRFWPAWYPATLRDRNTRILGELQPATRDRAFRLLQAAMGAGHALCATSGFRSLEDQQRLHEARESNPYPVGSPGGCGHERGRAFDVAFARPEDATPAAWDVVGRLGEALGLEWGGRWASPDVIHFQERGCPPITPTERHHIATVLQQRGHGTSVWTNT